MQIYAEGVISYRSLHQDTNYAKSEAVQIRRLVNFLLDLPISLLFKMVKTATTNLGKRSEKKNLMLLGSSLRNKSHVKINKLDKNAKMTISPPCNQQLFVTL